MRLLEGSCRKHQLESRMREIRQSGSEGGVAQPNAPSLPPIWTLVDPRSERFDDEIVLQSGLPELVASLLSRQRFPGPPPDKE